MLLTTEELLHILMGDASVQRLRVLLDRLDECPESQDALRVLVALRANRTAALEVLELERLHDLDTELGDGPQPWASQGLRLAIWIAVAAVLAAWLILS